MKSAFPPSDPVSRLMYRAYARWHDGAIIFAAFAMVALYRSLANGSFPLDDSWIHQTYGRNLGLHGEWAFLRGVPSVASTSPLYTAVLAIGYFLRLPPLLWTHGIGAAALAITGLLGARIAAHLYGQSRSLPLLTGLALVGAWHLVWGAASGMETGIFAMLTLLVPFLLLREWEVVVVQGNTNRALILRAVFFGIAVGLLTLTRPEGMLLIVLCGAALLIVRPQGWRATLIYGVVAVAAFFVVLMPYLFFNLSVTGGLLPNTAAAKVAFARPILELDYPYRLWLMTQPLLAGGQILLIPGLIASVVMAIRTLLLGPRDGAVKMFTPFNLIFPVWGVGLVALYAAALPLPFQHGRYVIPALPALIVSGMIGTGRLIAWSKSNFTARVVMRALAISTGAIFFIFALGVGIPVYRQDVRIIEEEMVGQALWIADNLPDDELLVINDIGAVGYFAPRPMLDIAGLVSPEMIPLIGNGIERWEVIRAREGRYLMAFDDQIPSPVPYWVSICLLHRTTGVGSQYVGGTKMTLYRIVYDATCDLNP